MVLYLARANGIRISYPFNNTAIPSTLVSAQVNGSHLRLHYTYRGWQVCKVVSHIGFHSKTAQRTILVPICNVEVPKKPRFTELLILLLSPSQLPFFRSFLCSSSTLCAGTEVFSARNEFFDIVQGFEDAVVVFRRVLIFNKFKFFLLDFFIHFNNEQNAGFILASYCIC